MTKYVVEDTKLVGIADAIRSKTGETGAMTVGQMAGKISGITGSGSSSSRDRSADLITRDFVSWEDDDVTSIGNGAFYKCYDLISVSFPACTTIEDEAFLRCGSLNSVNFPNVTTIRTRAFGLCENLVTASFPACVNIDNLAFDGCKNLTRLYLPGLSLCNLEKPEALQDTPIEIGTGYIYVPSSLLESYKTAPNWSYYSDKIKAIGSAEPTLTFTVNDIQYEYESGMTFEEWINSDYNDNLLTIDEEGYVYHIDTEMPIFYGDGETFLQVHDVEFISKDIPYYTPDKIMTEA